MIEIPITDEMIRCAKTWYDFKVLKNSIKAGAGNLAGALGEILVGRYFTQKYDTIYCGTGDYDWKIQGQKVEVKTKYADGQWPPRYHWKCSVPDTSDHQVCDLYFFVFIKKDLSSGILAGYISRKEFNKKAIHKKKGDRDWDGFIFKGDCKNIEIGSIKPFKQIRLAGQIKIPFIESHCIV